MGALAMRIASNAFDLSDVRSIDSARSELAALLERCSDDEIEVFLYQARRVDKARTQYGPLNLDDDSRDWDEEKRQELADAAMYEAFAAVAKARKR